MPLYSLITIRNDLFLLMSTLQAIVQMEDFSPRSFRWVMTMVFAIDEINRNSLLLPNATLGYVIYDSCYDSSRDMEAVLHITEQEARGIGPIYNCTPRAVIAESGTTLSIPIARFLGHYSIPQVSYFASCKCLSDKKLFPSFFRTIPSDGFQASVMAQIVQYFGWVYVGTVENDDEYGRNGVSQFLVEAELAGLCGAFRAILPQTKARVVLVFSSESALFPLAEELQQRNATHKIWIASEGWATSYLLGSTYSDIFKGTISIALRQGEILGLGKFLNTLRPQFPSEHVTDHRRCDDYYKDGITPFEIFMIVSIYPHLNCLNSIVKKGDRNTSIDFPVVPPPINCTGIDCRSQRAYNKSDSTLIFNTITSNNFDISEEIGELKVSTIILVRGQVDQAVKFSVLRVLFRGLSSGLSLSPGQLPTVVRL
uniref:Receptor ligand binding region domain-containing protein n=1 Tax=Eptatretus burgeri TaxID=7764 RepID=A0A8C4QV25_EPTBU